MLPILFQNHDLILYSYPLIMGIGWGIGYQIFFSLLPQPHTIRHQILFWGLFLFSWLGAKLFFLLTTHGQQNLAGQVSFWTGGGFVFYGGFLGACVFCVLYHFSISKLNLASIWPMIPALCFGHGVGRIGCLLAGCCFGKETDLWWGIFIHGAYRHPTQLIEAVFLIGLGLVFLKSHKDKIQLIAMYLCLYGLARLGIEALRGDEVRGQWGMLTPSQWLSLGMIVSGLSVRYHYEKQTS